MSDITGSAPIVFEITGAAGDSAYQIYAAKYLNAHGNDPTGMLNPTDWLANSGMTFNASGIAYGTGTVQQALDALNYSGMHITSMTVTPPQAEIGSSVNLNVHWVLNRNPTAQTMNGSTIPSGYRDFGVNGVSATTNYTLVSTDASAPGGSTSDTKTTGIVFLNKGHAGTVNKSDGATLTAGDVNGMSQSWFADAISRTLSFTTAADGYVWYSQPASQADPTAFKINGFVVTPTKTTRTHTTATGQTASYKDFRLSDILTAGATIVLEVIA